MNTAPVVNDLQPALFLGHGSPMLAITESPYASAWRRIGERLTKPRAVLAISAHWYRPGLAVTADEHPRTIHDFGGFPDALYQVQYPAPGSPQLAARVKALLAPREVEADQGWGLDHGAWAVLRHLFPTADVPVVQLRIDAAQPPEFHFELGQALAPLRREGILLLGSGNVVHNLRRYDWAGDAARPQDWARRFEQRVQDLCRQGDAAALVHYPGLGEDARLSIPTPEHFLPLLYVLGARLPGDTVDFPVAGIDGGTISMLAVELNGAQ